MLKYNNKKYVCHLDLAMDLIRGKWQSVIICHLNRGPKRFLQLQKTISGISQKFLNEKLTELEKDDLIFKTTYPEAPPRVEYELTKKGKELFPSLNLLEQWSKKYFSDL